LAQPGEHHAAAQKLAQRAAASDADDAWAVVFLFYCSLHLIDGYLKTKGARFEASNHGARRGAIKLAPELRQADPAYRELQSLSEQVRYDPCFVPTTANLASARQLAEKIRSIVEPKLQHKLASPT